MRPSHPQVGLPRGTASRRHGSEESHRGNWLTWLWGQSSTSCSLRAETRQAGDVTGDVSGFKPPRPWVRAAATAHVEGALSLPLSFVLLGPRWTGCLPQWRGGFSTQVPLPNVLGGDSKATASRKSSVSAHSWLSLALLSPRWLFCPPWESSAETIDSGFAHCALGATPDAHHQAQRPEMPSVSTRGRPEPPPSPPGATQS